MSIVLEFTSGLRFWSTHTPYELRFSLSFLFFSKRTSHFAQYYPCPLPLHFSFTFSSSRIFANSKVNDDAEVQTRTQKSDLLLKFSLLPVIHTSLISFSAFQGEYEFQASFNIRLFHPFKFRYLESKSLSKLFLRSLMA